MAERTLVTDVVQLGIETTPGTAVPANRQLPTLELNPGVDSSFTNVRPSGSKFNTLNVIGKEWSTATFKMGAVTYDELTYILAAFLNAPTPTVQGATTAYLWDFSPSAITADTVKSLTVEHGSAVDRDKIELSGSMIGQAFSSGITLTATPTIIDLVPILAKNSDIYIDPLVANIGTTKVPKAFSWELKMANRFSPLWVIDSTKLSWGATYENAIDATLKISMEGDATGMGYLTQMRAASTQFARIKVVSADLAGAAFPYTLMIDAAIQVAESPKQFGDNDGVVSIDWNFGVVYNPGWTRAVRAQLTNKRATL
jgi:hypothetical protein